MKSFVIPDIYCPFPSQISPHLEHVQRHTVEWVQSLGLVQKETALQRFLEIAGYACRTHPHAGLEELIILSNWYCWASVYDDQLDESELGRRLEYMHTIEQHLLAVFQPSTLATPQEPIVQALFDVWQRIGNLTSSVWQRRFAQHHGDFFAANRRVAENRANQHVSDIDTYINNRQHASGFFLCFDLVELAAHVDIPSAVYESQPFQALLHAACNIASWTNDVYSLQKELAHGELDNLVVVVQHTHGCSIQEAVNQVCDMLETETRRFQELVHRFCASSCEVDRAIDIYLVDLGNWIRGNLDWSCKSVRYNT